MIYFITRQPSIKQPDNLLPEYRISTECTIKDVVNYFRDKNEVQVDTETQGDFNFVNQILTLQFGDEENQFVIEFAYLSQEEKNAVNEYIFMNENLTKILHNSKYDIKYLWFHGFDIINVYDTMLAELILNAGKDVDKGFYSLYGLCQRYLGVTLDKETRGIINKLGLNTRVIKYAADDVKYLSRIKQVQHEQMIKYHLAKRDHQDIYTVCGLEMNAILPLASIEYNGMKLNTAKWATVKARVHEELDNVSKEIDRIVASEPKLYTAIYQDLFTPAHQITTVNWSSASQKLAVLKKLFPKIQSTAERELSRYKGKHPIVDALLKYNKAKKLATAFADTLESHINPITGRIHTDIWPILDTGRISTSKPNLQQIPSRTDIGAMMRACFVPEEGYVMVGGDYSGCELRLIAEGSKDPVWVSAFREGKDLHSELCALTFDIPLSDVKTPSKFKPDLKYRDIQKTLNFGLAYGMSEYKLADTIEVSVDEARGIIEKFFSRVPDVKKFLDMLGYLGKTRGFIRTLKPYSRIRWFDGYQNIGDFKRQGEIDRASRNHPIQGGNADMTKLGLVLTYREIKEKHLPAKIVHAVHDEIQTECLASYAEEWRLCMSELMIDAAKAILKTVPMEVDCKVSDHWSK